MTSPLFCARHYHGGQVALVPPCPWCRVEELKRERDEARANARVLAHAYAHDSAPPQGVVMVALGYPSGGENKGAGNSVDSTEDGK